MKNIKSIICTLFIAAFCVGFFLACQNPFELPFAQKIPPQQYSAGEVGFFSLETGNLYTERTILPTTVQSNFALYTLVFSSSGKDNVSVDRTNANLVNPITLSVGTWNLMVTAFMDSGKTRPAAQGSLTEIGISIGANTSRNLELKPIIEAGATGTFSWNIVYPSEVTVAGMTIVPLDTQTGTPEQTLYFKGGTPIVNGNSSASPLSLNTGYYRVEFNLKNGSHDTGRVEYLHIYKNMLSQFAYTFTQDHFTVYSVTNGEDSGPGSFRYAITNAASNSTILIEDFVGTIALKSRLEISKNLSIAGSGVTITRDGSWSATSNTTQLLGVTSSSANVSISRIHFKDGRATNNGAAILNQGNLDLGSCIFSGNTTSVSSAYGGAIYSQTGTLSVKGCTFYGNSTAYRGGAIYLSNGTLNLTGNLFYDNSAAANGGPAVYRYGGTVTSHGYNAVNLLLGTGATESGWTAGTGDKIIIGLPLSAETFQPFTGAVTVNVIAVLPAGYPTVDFYGSPITNGAAAGAVQSTVADPRPALTGSVSVTGTFHTGQTLTADITNLNGSGTVSYFWMRGTTVIGTNSSTYVLQSSDVGSAITVTVVRSNNSGRVTSVSTSAVVFPPLAGTVSISGTAQQGQTLTANTSALGGIGTIFYQWKRGTTDIGTNSSIYVLQSADVGSTITVTVTRSGYTGSLTSAPTAAVAGVPANYLRLPYYYPGTGKTYNGYSGTDGTLTTNGGVTVTHPAQTTFSADAFFTLEGVVNNSAAYNYAFVVLTKDSDPTNLRTTYLVNDSFKQRIWLRFGAGAYTVKVHGLSTINFSSEGAYLGCSYWSSSVTFYITNTRDEGDQRFIYPSYICQSDDLMITNLAAELTNGLIDDTAKIKAIFDYIIKNTIYDSASIVSSQRKKQDAVSVLGTRYSVNSLYPDGHFLAVCEGYANTFAALARVAGFATRYVSSASMNHGWNHVYVNGGWKFIDVTWGDPLPDRGPAYVSYTYYLLDSLNGYNNSHTGWEVDNSRIMIGNNKAPWQRDVPDGWY